MSPLEMGSNAGAASASTAAPHRAPASPTAPSPGGPGASHGSSARHLVLLGAGATHRRLVRLLARRPLPAGLAATWLVPADSVLPLERVPACIAGTRDWAQATVALAPLAAAAGVRLLVRRAQAPDAATRSIALDGHEHLVWDLLSVDAEPLQDRAALESQLPGAREHGLFVCPPAALAALWPRVLALPAPRRGRIAVLGGDALAVETAFALRAAQPDAAVSLLAGDGPLLAGLPQAVRARVTEALRRARIDVLPHAPRAVEAGAVRLGEGTTLACDLPLVVQGRSVQQWPDSQPDAGLPVFQLPAAADPALAARLRRHLERLALGRTARPLGPGRLRLQTLWLGPGRALAFGARWQMGGPIARWIDRWLHDR